MDVLSFWPYLIGFSGIFVLIGLASRSKNRIKNNGLSPLRGPIGWPVVGSMMSLLPAKLHDNMKYFIDKYGPIFQIRLGSFDTVVIADYKMIKKAFNTMELSDRPAIYLFELVSRGNHGIASASGPIWQEHRRFALRHLRDLGLGKSSVEVHVQREVVAMLEELKKSLGNPIDLSFKFNIAITNIIWALVSGKRMEYDDPKILGFMAAMNRNIEHAATMGIVGFIPWLKDLLPRSWLKVDLIESSLEAVEDYFKELIKEHRETFNPDDLRDYIDHFLDEAQRQGENSTFTDLQLVVSMGDLFVGGGETTATTLRWAVMLLAYYPELQTRLQDEIDRVVGRHRLPGLEDREAMPYTEAVIHEVQRFADVIPMGIFHASRQSSELEGFAIPANSMIMGYVGQCHRSPKYWNNPHRFDPQHFLNPDGSLRKNVEGFLPFSIGKRQCIGESLARMELFLFLTYFFQTFSFHLCEPFPTLDVNPKSGLVRWPNPYKVRLELR